MALTRTNPMHDLKRTAKDLATFIIDSEKETLRQCLQEARDIYQPPLTSWTKAINIVYYLFGTRRRSDDINKAIIEMLTLDPESSKAEPFQNLFEKGGWEETSFNTTLMRVMVRHLNNYDQNIMLPLPLVTELKALLMYELARQLNEDQISKQQTVIDSLKAKKIEMNNELTELTRELREYEGRLNALKSDENEELIAEHQKRQQVLDDYQLQIKKLDAERQQQEKELEKIKLFSFKPNMDLSKLTEEQMKEMQHQIEVTIDLYLKDLEAKTSQRRELNAVKDNGAANKAKSQLQGLSLFNHEMHEEQAKHKQQEVQAVTGAADGFNKSFKENLAKMLGGRTVPKQKSETAVPYRTKKALASVVVVENYTPETAPQIVAEAQAVVANTGVKVVAARVQEQEKIDGEQFANAKQALATLFANRQPRVKVEEAKPVPSSMVL